VRKGLGMHTKKECNSAKDKEWCEWRKAKKEKRLTEHRRQLKKQASKKDTARQR